ncbi:MAG: aminotransferase class V-fold PLP-dependent enzyme [Bacteroidota bacterium]
MNVTNPQTKLLTPGPVPVPEFVMNAIYQAVIPHRSAAFEAFYGEMLNRLAYLFMTNQRVCSMIGSGTYGVEAAMYSLFQKGETVLVVDMGKFSERWADYGELLGLEVIRLTKEWGDSAEVSEIMTLAAQCEDLRGIVLTHSETSSAAMLDLEEVSWAIKQQFPQTLILVDAITSVGCMPFYFDKWQIDCAVVASQKALMNPAGLVAFAISEQAYKRMQDTHASDSRNLLNYLHFAQRNNYPYTPPVQLLYGVDAALKYVETERLPTLWNRCHHAAQTFRTGLKSLGGQLIAASPSESLSAFAFPDQDMTVLKTRLEEEYAIQVSGGQAHLAGTILRVSHMGMADAGEMDNVLKALASLL